VISRSHAVSESIIASFEQAAKVQRPVQRYGSSYEACNLVICSRINRLPLLWSNHSTMPILLRAGVPYHMLLNLHPLKDRAPTPHAHQGGGNCALHSFYLVPVGLSRFQ
jgi:hypothetical protein